MEFNADAERKARTPWSIVIGGRRYTAALVSRVAVQDFWAVVEQAKKGGVSREEERAAVEGLFRVAFPMRLSYHWRDPVKLIMAMEDEELAAALQSFWQSLANRFRSPAPGTNGTNGSRPSSVGASG